ncbi:MAG: ATP-grasp domain-containing protein [Mesorhizobium sp.]|nr:MAG: ATP-grasp domain-containing protein [Mesorhizobium sp.]
MRIAVVWNSERTGVISRFGQTCYEGFDRETIESVAAALQEEGHETLICEGDKDLLPRLERFMPQDKVRPSGIAFNMTYGIQGECRLAHVPAMLEMAGVPYTGSNPLGHGIALDKVTTKRLIRDCGIPTPRFSVIRHSDEDIGDLKFPIVVKPRHESDSCGVLLVHDPVQLRRGAEVVFTKYRQEALLEEYIEGREIWVSLLGNEEPNVLPLVEHDFTDCNTSIMTWDMKHALAGPPQRICPAQLESSLIAMLREISIRTFRVCQCRDYARIDLRIDRSGQPFVLEINSMPGLGSSDTYGVAATIGGHNFSSLVNRILDIAHTRYFGIGVAERDLGHIGGGTS